MKRLRPVPLEVVKERLPKHIEVDESTYTNTFTKARFIDADYGEFWAIPKDVWSGHGHRLRANDKIRQSKVRPLEEVIHDLPSGVRLKEETYAGMNHKSIFVDDIYGEFVATPKEVINGKVHRQRAIDEKRNIKLTAGEIQEKLPEFLTLVEESYINTTSKAVFIDAEFGEFRAKVNEILFRQRGHPERGKRSRKETCERKYGVSHVMRLPEVMSKARRSMRKNTTILHWKTGDDIVCSGSYERAVVEYLNRLRLDFDWQVPFSLPDDTVYYCDLYIKEDDTYVEIKGWWMQEKSRRKWEMFHALHKNSELWDRAKLKSMGLPVK